MKRVVLRSPAKVNLSLAITGRRKDGYHELISLVAPLAFGDEVEVEANETVSGEITSTDALAQTITVGADVVTIVAGTRIEDDDSDLSFSDLAAGQLVEVDGVTLSDGTFIARRVDIDGTVSI